MRLINTMVPLLAILSSLAFAGSNVCTRRATLWVAPAHGVRLAALLGLVLFALLALLFGEAGHLFQLSWRAYLFFAGAGIVHFILGRSFGYFAFRAIGASRATVAASISPLVSVGIAVPLFGDTLTWPVAIAAFLVVIGPVLMAEGERRTQNPVRPTVATITPSQLRRGVLLALGAALFWGISPILVKAGLEQARYPILGTFISYSTAALLLSSLLMHRQTRHQFFHMDPQGLKWFFLSGLSVSMAQFFRYLVLNQANVTVSVLLMQAGPLFVFGLTYLLNRSIESLNPYVIGGGVLVVIGTAILTLVA